jgi:hypothetical protein
MPGVAAYARCAASTFTGPKVPTVNSAIVVSIRPRAYSKLAVGPVAGTIIDDLWRQSNIARAAGHCIDATAVSRSYGVADPAQAFDVPLSADGFGDAGWVAAVRGQAGHAEDGHIRTGLAGQVSDFPFDQKHLVDMWER